MRSSSDANGILIGGPLAVATLGALAVASCAESIPRVAPVAVDVVATTDGEPIDGLLRAVDVSRDGRVVAFQSDASNLVPRGTGLYVVERPGWTARPIAYEGSLERWRLSEDGAYLVLITGLGTTRVALAGDEPTTMVAAGDARWPAIFADASGAAWLEDGAVQVAYFDRPERLSIALPLPGAFESTMPGGIIASRDNGHLAVAALVSAGTRSDYYYYLVDLAARTAVELPIPAMSLSENAVFSDDSEHLVVQLRSQPGEYLWLPVDGGPASRRVSSYGALLDGPLDDDRLVVRGGPADPDPRTVGGLGVVTEDGASPVLAEGLDEPMPSVAVGAVAAAAHELVAAFRLTERPGRWRLVAVSLDPVLEP